MKVECTVCLLYQIDFRVICWLDIIVFDYPKRSNIHLSISPEN